MTQDIPLTKDGTPRKKPGGKPVTKHTRYCEVCGKSHKFYVHDIHRGKGLYCCRQCAQYGRKVHQYKTKFKICTVCLLPFKTSVDSMEQCCVEHEYAAASLTLYKVNDGYIAKPAKLRKMRRYQANQRKLRGLA